MGPGDFSIHESCYQGGASQARGDRGSVGSVLPAAVPGALPGTRGFFRGTATGPGPWSFIH
ncbi:MAG TPA: hypothetical protein P5536_08525 [Methanoregulaceae archaeon]|nr:MAG: hypothetical protein IPI71_09440 [Methanolinea sp.]HON82260.1 hypothetical protein [Methanoregulaceae archaeon]HRT16097.1 hypothetical protein [Methanoregulaceae archaeon]HRU31636.1 hypothetical protein [Methanoregulaceae archaeon]